MCTNHEPQETPVEKETDGARQYPCGYCGSTKPLIPYEEMYGPGAVGWDCCPDCGGV